MDRFLVRSVCVALPHPQTGTRSRLNDREAASGSVSCSVNSRICSRGYAGTPAEPGWVFCIAVWQVVQRSKRGTWRKLKSWVRPSAHRFSIRSGELNASRIGSSRNFLPGSGKP